MAEAAEAAEPCGILRGVVAELVEARDEVAAAMLTGVTQEVLEFSSGTNAAFDG